MKWQPIDVGIRFPSEAEQLERRAHRTYTAAERLDIAAQLFDAAWVLAAAGGQATPHTAHRVREETLAHRCWIELVQRLGRGNTTRA